MSDWLRTALPASRKSVADGFDRLEARFFELAQKEARLLELTEKGAHLLELIEEKFDPNVPLKMPPNVFKNNPNGLRRKQGQVYSQNSEDAIIAGLFATIGTSNRVFLEIGIDDGKQCNTRLLLESGWTGTWIEGDPEYAQFAREAFAVYVASGQLKIVDALVTAEDINELVKAAGVPPHVDFLSLDIDMNTTHVWRAVDISARLSCIEYNSYLPSAASLEVEYDGSAVWDGTRYFGGSLKRIEQIGHDKGLALLGCDEASCNAFLISRDLADGQFPGPFNAEALHMPPVDPDSIPPSPIARRWIRTT